jgi:hypothetical protein
MGRKPLGKEQTMIDPDPSKLTNAHLSAALHAIQWELENRFPYSKESHSTKAALETLTSACEEWDEILT